MNRVCDAVLDWIKGEVDPVRRLFTCWSFYAVLLAVAGMVFAAYQVRSTYSIDVGGKFDAPYVSNFYPVEKNEIGTFRWTRESGALRLLGVGQDDYNVDLSIIGYRPDGNPPVLSVSINGKHFGEFQTTGAPEKLSFGLSREQTVSGDARIRLETTPFDPENDSRTLGVVVDSIMLTHTGSGFIIPAWEQVLTLLAVVALVALFGVRLGLSNPWATAAALAFGLCLALILAFARLWITPFSSQLLQSFVAGYIGLVAMWLAVGVWYRLTGVTVRPAVRNALFAAFAGVFVMRLAGQLHPQIYIMDVIFHLHRLEQVLSGDLFFTIKSGEWGGKSTFYLPTVYLFMVPFFRLFSDPVFLVKLFTVLMDSTAMFLVFYIVWRTMRDERGALISAILYGIMPFSFLVFSWGITSNLFGQWIALAVMAVLATVYDKLNRWLVFVMLTLLLLLGFLSHPGVVVLLAGAMAFFVIVHTLSRRPLALERGTLMLVIAGVLAAGIAFAGYYSRFVDTMTTEAASLSEERAEAMQGEGYARTFYIGGSVTDVSLDLRQYQVHSVRELPLEVTKALYHEAKAFYRLWPLAGLFLGLSLLFISQRGKQLPWLMLAWVLSAAVFAVFGVINGLFVRYMLFLLPVIAIGSGVFLAKILLKNRAGQIVAALMMAYMLWSGMSLWYDRVMYGFH